MVAGLTLIVTSRDEIDFCNNTRNNIRLL